MFIQIIKDEPFEYWSEEHFLKELPLKFELSLVAVNDFQIVGYIIASANVDCAYIHKFMVDSSYRGQQIGTMLQDVFNKNLIKLGFFSIKLCVMGTNKKAISFYKKNGYFPIGRKMDSINNVELITMKKNIL